MHWVFAQPLPNLYPDPSPALLFLPFNWNTRNRARSRFLAVGVLDNIYRIAIMRFIGDAADVAAAAGKGPQDFKLLSRHN